MKKIILLFVLLAIYSNSSFASLQNSDTKYKPPVRKKEFIRQEAIIKKQVLRKRVFSIGYPIMDDYYNAEPIPLFVAYDSDIDENITVGAFITFGRIYYYNYYSNERYSYYVIGMRGIYNFIKYKRFRFYGVFMLGYCDVVHPLKEYENNLDSYVDIQKPFQWSAHIGTRIMLGSRFGIYGEAGYGLNWGTIGITLAF